jgi:hypothetical protein
MHLQLRMTHSVHGNHSRHLLDKYSLKQTP